MEKQEHSYRICDKIINDTIDSLIAKFEKESRYYQQGKTVLGFFTGLTIKEIMEKNILNDIKDLDVDLIKSLIIEKLSKIK